MRHRIIGAAAQGKEGRRDQPIGSQAIICDVSICLLTVVMPVICWYYRNPTFPPFFRPKMQFSESGAEGLFFI